MGEEENPKSTEAVGSAKEGQAPGEGHGAEGKGKEQPVVSTPDLSSEIDKSDKKVEWEKEWSQKTPGEEGNHKSEPGVQKSIGWEHKWAPDKEGSAATVQTEVSGKYGESKSSLSFLHYKEEIKSEGKLNLDKRELSLTPIEAKVEGSFVHAQTENELDVGSWLKGLFGSSGAPKAASGGGGGGGPFAARVGDPTAHGTPLAPGIGSINVLIGGQPAWRAGVDMHICPVVKGVVPDVGGMVAVGAPTVLINNFPACRMGDQVVEIPGGPNPIVMGCPTVMIGGGGGGGGSGSGEGGGDGGTGLKANLNAEGDLGYARAEAQVGIVADKTGVEAVAKAGAMVAKARGQVQGSLTIPLPFDHKLTLGGAAEGTAGSLGAEGEASAGYSADKGFHAKLGAKAGAGLGLGLSFSIGLQ